MRGSYLLCSTNLAAKQGEIVCYLNIIIIAETQQRHISENLLLISAHDIS